MLYTAVTLLVGTSLASSCTSRDKTVWDNTVKAKFQQDEKHCALRCAGANPCTGDCISNTYGLSHSCGQCFGGLSECVVRHCVVYPGNCGVNPNGEGCKKCTNQYCTPAFEKCTGFTPPSAELKAPARLTEASWCQYIGSAIKPFVPECASAKATLGAQLEAEASWCQYIGSAVKPFVPECSSALAKATLGAQLEEASWCQYIGSAVKPFVPECASAKATLGTQLEEASWCQYIGSAVKPFVPECASAKATLEAQLKAEASWCQYIGSAIKPFVPECAKATLGAQLEAEASWCQYIGSAVKPFVPECSAAALQAGPACDPECAAAKLKSLSTSGAFQF